MNILAIILQFVSTFFFALIPLILKFLHGNISGALALYYSCLFTIFINSYFVFKNNLCKNITILFLTIFTKNN